MKMYNVTSTAMRAVGYDRATQRLRIKFPQGHIMEFSNVPEHIYLGLMSATSKGRYFDQQIRDRYQ